MDSARNVMGCHVNQTMRVEHVCDDAASTIHHSTQETRVLHVFDDAASTIHQSYLESSDPAGTSTHSGGSLNSM